MPSRDEASGHEPVGLTPKAGSAERVKISSTEEAALPVSPRYHPVNNDDDDDDEMRAVARGFA